MLRRHVERFEVVVIVLEIGPFDDEESLAQEEALDAIAQQRERMTMPDEWCPSRERDVDRIRCGFARGCLRQTFGELRVDVLLELVRLTAEHGPLLGRGGRNVLQQVGDQPSLAREILVAQGAQVRLARGTGEVRSELLLEGCDVHAVLQEDTRPGGRVTPDLLISCRRYSPRIPRG